jgi:hypothetical protein
MKIPANARQPPAFMLMLMILILIESGSLAGSGA